MPAKQFTLSNAKTIVSVHKRRSSRNLRLSVKPDGKVHVSIPLWASYRSAVAFAESRLEWITKQQVPSGLLVEGQLIGKTHSLHFVQRSAGVKPGSRVLASKVIVNYPATLLPESPEVQTIAESAAERALRKQAEVLLQPRLDALAEQHGFTYRSMGVKKLKSRWGSCDSHKHIVFNIFLMQLEDHLIDYVILHELTHTEHLHHGPSFWTRMEEICPNYKWLRKAVHSHKPIVTRT